MKIVLNMEPLLYSEEAKKLWCKEKFEYFEGNWNRYKSNKVLKKAEVIIVRLSKKIDKKILSCFENLKYIISATTGLDHIDLKETSNRGIKVFSLKNETNFLKTIPSTAEHTWALLLSLARKIPEASNDVRLGNWKRDNFRGVQLKNKSLGIIGLGRVGNQVASFAKIFQMKVNYFDPYVTTKKRYNKFTNVEELLAQSDFISVHIHLNEKNFNFINKSRLSHVKKGTYFINTSRGNVWNENEVVELYKKGIIAGIATDVITDEMGKEIKSPILNLHKKLKKNIIVTPHIAGATYEAMWDCEKFIADLFLKSL